MYAKQVKIAKTTMFKHCSWAERRHCVRRCCMGRSDVSQRAFLFALQVACSQRAALVLPSERIKHIQRCSRPTTYLAQSVARDFARCQPAALTYSIIHILKVKIILFVIANEAFCIPVQVFIHIGRKSF